MLREKIKIAKPATILKIFLLCAWTGATLYGFNVLLTYTDTPGITGNVSTVWPAGSKISRSSNLPALVMTVHPQCPCTRASLGELEELMAHVQGRVQVYVLFSKPSGFPDSKVYSTLWQTAKKISGVQVIFDEDGQESKIFGTQVSGEALLYDREGHLLFHGGMTASRGHFGDNAGKQAIMDYVLTGTAHRHQTFVFGCPLFNHLKSGKGFLRGYKN